MVRKPKAPPEPTRVRRVQAGGFTVTEGIHRHGSQLPWHDHATPTICFVLNGTFTEVWRGGSVACVSSTLKFTPAGARHRIHAELSHRPSLSSLARAVGVHPVTLARAFRQAFGCTVGEYVRQLRIERAAHQLAGTELSLAEIALAAGFSDQSHFSNMFRERTGLSPSKFRRVVRPA